MLRWVERRSESLFFFHSTQVYLHSESQITPHFALPEFNPPVPGVGVGYVSGKFMSKAFVN